MLQWPTKRNVPQPHQAKSPSRNLLSVSPKSRSIPETKESFAFGRLLTPHQQFRSGSDANHENQIDSRIVVLRSRQIYVAATIWLLATRNDLRKGHDLWYCRSPQFQHRIQKCVRAEVKQTSLQGSAYHFQRTSPLTGLWISKLRENCILTANETTSFSEYRIWMNIYPRRRRKYKVLPKIFTFGC